MSEEQNSQAQERSHEATPARLEKARREGDVAQSKELNAAAGYIGFYLALAFVAAGAAGQVAFLLLQMLGEPDAFSRDAFEANNGAFIFSSASTILSAAGPFLLFPFVATLGALVAQRAIAFAPSKIKPKFSKLSFVSNAKKKYGPDGLADFAKSAAKLMFVFILFGFLFMQQLSTLPVDARLPAVALPQGLMKEAVIFVGVIVLFSVLIAAIDLPWSRSRYAKRMRMTLEELKKETKENEGNPEMKQSRRERAQAIAQNKMLQDVPDADVVIVNPTHYAVALKWERNKLGAPICVAKGVDLIAARIREIAATEGVPIRSDPPTARAIHGSVEVGEEIKREHYAAVAAAIHFADAIRAKARAQ